MIIETILEGGSLTEDECRKALAGKQGTPEVRACISWIEYHIGLAHQDAEDGTGVKRDEGCGAAKALRMLRGQLKEMLESQRREEVTL
jgi:hypothetical protein